MKAFAQGIMTAMVVLLLTPVLSYAQDPCECTNCPVPIMDNGTFNGYLNVNVAGPNNLGLCPLQQVCFTITHTWVGDLSVTLTSPSGLNYLVMADDNNNFTGCGTDADNVDVCISVGTGNPLTNNGPYTCNNGNPCLTGGWTMPCGGVTDPVSGAVQSPNCNLNDFNIPGAPANGTWTLTVNDICNADVGFLQNWSLVFACGTTSCITCEPEGGALNQPDVSGCLGDPSLDLSISPTYSPPSSAPDPDDYSYTYVVSNASNGSIISFVDGPDLGSVPPGTYQVCGLSYATDDASQLFFYLGTTLAQLQAELDAGTASFCGDLSDDCFTATIGPPIPPTILDTMICLGDCYVAPDGTQCCTPGPCQYTLTSYLGCDSTIIMNVIPAPIDFETITEVLCFGECITYDGAEYCAPGGFTLEYTNQFGCDSLVFLQLVGVPVGATILEPDTLTCSNTSINLDGSTSAGTSFSWIDPSGTEIGTTPFQVVSTPGCYDLIVGNTISGVTCYDTATVCVVADLDVPEPPVIMGETLVCGNEIITYTLNPDPLANSYGWTFPGDATLVDGGNGFTYITIDWTGSMGGQVCASGQNGCGIGPVGCADVTLIAVPAQPTVTGLDTVCAGGTTSYSITADPIISTITWSVPAGAMITNGQGTNQIDVFWGSTSGDVCVVVGNNCGDQAPVCLGVTVEDVLAVPVVSGPSPVCPGASIQYTVPVDPNATGYTWTLPACATIISGQGTNTLTVVFDAACAGGDICVTADNDCGASAPGCLPVVVDPLAVDPTLSGPDPVCINEVATYMASVITGGTDYAWTVSGGTILSGQGTTSLEVEWTTGGQGQVCVTASTACSSSAQICQNVQVNEPANTPTISGPSIVCDGSVVDYTVAVDPNATGYNWSLSCGTILAGQNTNTITVDWSGCPTGGDVCLILDSNCGSTLQVCLPVQGGTQPQDPAIAGVDMSCLAATETYCVGTDPNVSNYNWVATTGTIISGQGMECVEVSWDTPGAQQICVTAENACGPSNQICFDVEVDEVPGASTISGDNQVCNGENSTLDATNMDPTVTSYNWSVTGTCGTITSGQGTAQVNIDWSEAGVCEVCVEAVNQCGVGTISCYNVTVIAIPAPNAGADDGICGLTYPLNGQLSVGTGLWTVSGPGNVILDDPTNPNATATADTYGNYVFTWTVDDSGCIGSDDVTISFNDDPSIDGIVVEACSPSELDYTVTFDVMGGEMPYQITGATGGTFSGNTFTSDLILSGMTYSIEIFDANGCGPLLIEGQETCDCITTAGTMLTDTLEACVDATVTAVMPVDALFDMDDIDGFILHEDNGTNGSTLGTILEQNTTGTFGLTGGMAPGVVYYISYIIGNDDGTGLVDLTDDCTDISLGQPILFFEYPTPDAGADVSVCALTTTMPAMGSIYFGTWTQTAGPGTAVFSNINAIDSEVTVDLYGTYTFSWTEDNNGCTASDEVVITFNDDPMVAGPITEVCDLINFTYTVSFQISGGTPPYTVTGNYGGNLVGDVFTSDPIPSGTAYSFQITDVPACGPALLDGEVTCMCATDAGVMNNNLQTFCADETAIVAAATGQVLDPEDISLYVLHNGAGNTLGTEVYGYNSVPEFALVPPMQTGVTYYLSAIAGNDVDGDLQIDTNDPCVSVAAGTPIQFTALPVVSILEDATVCENETATLSLVVAAATCVDVSYTVSDGTMGTLVCVTDGATFTVPVIDQDLTVTITAVDDQNACQGISGATASITVNLIPEATVAPGATICNSTDSGNTTLLDFSTLVTAGDQAGTWINTDNAATSGNFPILDFTGVAPGTYTFTYTTNSAQAPCPEAVYTTSIIVEDCECPSLALLPPNDLCNDGDQLDLDDLVMSPEPGTWAIIGTPGGANPATLIGTQLNATGADAGTYTLEWTLSEAPPVGCQLSNTVTLDIQQSLSAGVANASLNYCVGENVSIDLQGQLTDADAGGVWTEESNQNSTGGAFNAAAGTFTTNGQVAGTYVFRYTVTPNAPCSADFAEVTVVINDLPGADAGPDLLLTCFEPFMEVGGTMASGTDLVYSWSAANGAFPGDSTVMHPFVNEPGTFTLTVTDLVTGCPDSDVVVVDAALDAPEPFFSLLPVSCFGDSDAAIIVDSVMGGTPPYVYSLNDEPFSNQSAFLGLTADTYTLVVEDINGCQNEVITIDISQPQELVVDLIAIVNSEDNVVTLGDSVSLNALITLPEDMIDSVQWTPAELVSCDTCLNTMATPLETTNFTVTVSSNGCLDSDNLNLLVRKNLEIYVPTGFSPDGDGVNDLFFPYAGPQVESIESFLVFNRWGETVFQYYNFLPNDPAYGWDGTHRGKLMDNGVFTWFAEVKLIDGRTEIFKGDVTLLR